MGLCRVSKTNSLCPLDCENSENEFSLKTQFNRKLTYRIKEISTRRGPFVSEYSTFKDLKRVYKARRHTYNKTKQELWTVQVADGVRESVIEYSIGFPRKQCF